MKLKTLLSSLLVAGAVLGSSAAFASPSYHANTINLGALEARIDSDSQRANNPCEDADR